MSTCRYKGRRAERGLLNFCGHCFITTSISAEREAGWMPPGHCPLVWPTRCVPCRRPSSVMPRSLRSAPSRPAAQRRQGRVVDRGLATQRWSIQGMSWRISPCPNPATGRTPSLPHRSRAGIAAIANEIGGGRVIRCATEASPAPFPTASATSGRSARAGRRAAQGPRRSSGRGCRSRSRDGAPRARSGSAARRDRP